MTTLKNLVDETTNIKNELVTCHTNLKNNLIEKGVECSDSDKLINLIDKIDNISIAKNVVASNNDIFYSEYCDTLSTSLKLACKFYIGFKGSIRVSSEANGVSGSYNGKLIYKVIREGIEVDSSDEFILTRSYVEYSHEFTNLEYGDFIEVYLGSPVNNYYARVRNIKLQGDIF